VLGGPSLVETGAPQSTICTTFPSTELGNKWYPWSKQLSLFAHVACKQENGTAQPSFVASHLAALAAEQISTQDDIDDIRGAAGTIYVGMVEPFPESFSVVN
jgi:hypothetical protein